MALNPGMLSQLEQRGMSNAALEQLLAFLCAGNSGSVTWHASQGELVKFDLRQIGSLKSLKDMQKVTKLFKS